MTLASYINTICAVGIPTMIIGYCYGYGAYDRVKKTIRFAIIQGMTIGLCVWAVCMIFAKDILLLFGTGSELYIQFGTSLIRTYLGLVFLNSVQITASNILFPTSCCLSEKRIKARFSP